MSDFDVESTSSFDVGPMLDQNPIPCKRWSNVWSWYLINTYQHRPSPVLYIYTQMHTQSCLVTSTHGAYNCPTIHQERTITSPKTAISHVTSPTNQFHSSHDCSCTFIESLHQQRPKPHNWSYPNLMYLHVICDIQLNNTMQHIGMMYGQFH